MAVAGGLIVAASRGDDQPVAPVPPPPTPRYMPGFDPRTAALTAAQQQFQAIPRMHFATPGRF